MSSPRPPSPSQPDSTDNSHRSPSFSHTNPPPHSRSPSVLSQASIQHAPMQPSGLRNAVRPPSSLSASPPDVRHHPPAAAGRGSSAVEEAGRGDIAPGQDDDAWIDEDEGLDSAAAASEQTHLLGDPHPHEHEHRHFSSVHPGHCNHGTFSPTARTHHSRSSRAGSLESAYGGASTLDEAASGPDVGQGLRARLGDGLLDGVLGRERAADGNGSGNGGGGGGGDGPKMTKTQRLARRHGVKNTKTMYISYYIPFFAWIQQYKWSYLKGDVVAALTVASIYIPMSLSYAANLGHIPPINGLYSFAFNPFVYALLGSCPQMVVGPEAAGSLLVGTVVRSSVDSGNSGDEDDIMNAQIAGVVTGMAGAVIFIAGLTRLGFLDSVLSRPFLRGFISAIGFVIFVDQLIPELGLTARAKLVGGVSHGSSVEKIGFLVRNVGYSHGLTAAVAFTSFAIIMVLREVKRRMQPRYPGVAYVPDRLLVVVLSAVFTWRFGWDKQGLAILGEVKSTTGSPFPFRWPFQFSHMKHVRDSLGTSFLIGLLGFFESSVAAKSLGGGEGRQRDGGIQGIAISPNRELVALGVANIVGGCFMALPAFGGYGRSKVNAATGAKTPMSSIVLSIITIICILTLLPYFYYLPKAVLSSMISVVAWSLIEEAPSDLNFFWKIRGWSELALMFLIFASTIFYSLTVGMAIGIGLSLIRVIRHSTRPRIQILGRIPGTDQFENAEANPEALEFVEGCLIVKIPEPLTFANTGELKSRLRRLELYGATAVHPALPRVRDPEHNKNVIFDVHGVTGLDGSGAQVLSEIVAAYRDRDVRVFFCRVPSERSKVYRLFESSGIVEKCGGPKHFVHSVDQALRLSELESLTEQFQDQQEE
ncbi:MAG: hypothetical protein M4579_003453 [Chaenotheca gracillima]|nr:MAG: hypothetical protein M4579_003453 [Chaenotheca gracillima]